VENQTTEWKETWRDDCLTTICAFANTNGGVLEIGRRNNGEVVGVDNLKKLLEDLPNKIRFVTGVVADIDVRESGGKSYLAIRVNPYPFPISCRGKYYQRSGSTTQELSGPSLDGFMLLKVGRTWDSTPLPRVKFTDFDGDAIRAFRRKALGSTRLTEEDLAVSDETLLRNLRLFDGDYLTSAAVLLFHPAPETWIFGASVKVGFFANKADISYMDEIRGPLITMADKVEEMVYSKYFRGIISYKGLQRIETYPIPRAAFREAILNAIVHRDYGIHAPIQVSIYPHEVRIHNVGGLPDRWTAEKLLAYHPSIPRNPLVAGAFFRSGQIEAWGRGVEKMVASCKEWGKPAPFYDVQSNGVLIGFKADVGIVGSIVSGSADASADQSAGLSEVRTRILALMRENPKISTVAIAEKAGIARRNAQIHIKFLKDAGLVKRIGTTKSGQWIVPSEEAVAATGVKTRTETRVETRVETGTEAGVKTGEKIIELTRENPEITRVEMAEKKRKQKRL